MAEMTSEDRAAVLAAMPPNDAQATAATTATAAPSKAKAKFKQAGKRQRGDGPTCSSVKDFFKKPKAEPTQPGCSTPISVKKESEDDHDVIVLD